MPPWQVAEAPAIWVERWLLLRQAQARAARWQQRQLERQSRLRR